MEGATGRTDPVVWSLWPGPRQSGAGLGVTDGSTRLVQDSQDPGDDGPPSLRLHPVPAPARRGWRQDRLLAGTGRPLQPQLSAGEEGPGLLRRVRCPRHRLLRLGAQGGTTKDPRAGPRVAGWLGRVLASGG